LEANKEGLLVEIEELSTSRYSLELSNHEKVQNIDDLKTFLNDQNEKCGYVEAENKLLRAKISSLEHRLGEMAT
jgi:hypothetical protein